MNAIQTINTLTEVLLSGDPPMERASHSIGVATGLRLAFRHPEYSRALLACVDKAARDRGVDAGRVAAERAIDGLIQLCPIDSTDGLGKLS